VKSESESESESESDSEEFVGGKARYENGAIELSPRRRVHAGLVLDGAR